MQQRKLYRSCKNSMLGGVAGGLGDYFDIDANIMRLIFVVLVFAGGASIILYIIAWIIIPLDPACGETNPKKEIREAAHKVSSEVKETVTENPSDARVILGLIILVLGAMYLAKNLTGIDFWHNFWPVILIVIGIVIILAGRQSKEKK